MSEETTTPRDRFCQEHPVVLEACKRLGESFERYESGAGQFPSTAPVVGAIRQAEREYDANS